MVTSRHLPSRCPGRVVSVLLSPQLPAVAFSITNLPFADPMLSVWAQLVNLAGSRLEKNRMKKSPKRGFAGEPAVSLGSDGGHAELWGGTRGSAGHGLPSSQGQCLSSLAPCYPPAVVSGPVAFGDFALGFVTCRPSRAALLCPHWQWVETPVRGPLVCLGPAFGGVPASPLHVLRAVPPSLLFPC